MTIDNPAVSSLSDEEAIELEELLRKLITINSINPWITPDGPAEGEVAAFIADWLSKIDGVEVLCR